MKGQTSTFEYMTETVNMAFWITKHYVPCNLGPKKSPVTKQVHTEREHSQFFCKLNRNWCFFKNLIQHKRPKCITDYRHATSEYLQITCSTYYISGNCCNLIFWNTLCTQLLIFYSIFYYWSFHYQSWRHYSSTVSHLKDMLQLILHVSMNQDLQSGAP